MRDRARTTGLGLLALAGMAGATWVRRRRDQGAASGASSGGAGDMSMGDMTRKLAKEQPPTPAGSGTIAWEPGGTSGGMSANEAASGQTLDSRMLQQFHQPAQGTDGGHAGGINVDREDDPSPSVSGEQRPG